MSFATPEKPRFGLVHHFKDHERWVISESVGDRPYTCLAARPLLRPKMSIAGPCHPRLGEQRHHNAAVRDRNHRRRRAGTRTKVALHVHGIAAEELFLRYLLDH